MWASPALAQTQAWPTRTVHFVLTLGAGSGTDIGGRLLADRLTKKWGQPVVIENRPGGDGIVAINAFVSAKDDHILLLTPTSSFIAHPWTHENRPYQAEDLAPIARVSNTVIGISVPKVLPVNSMGELVALAKVKPGELNWAGITGALDFNFAGWLKVAGPDPQEDHLQEANVYQSVTNAGLTFLDEEIEGTVSESVMHRLRERANDRTNAVWERLGGAETPSAQYSRIRTEMLARERAEVLRVRSLGTVDQTVLRRVLDALDVEESILDRLSEDETTADRETDLRPTYDPAGPCEHLAGACNVPTPKTPAGCEECLRDGAAWVHLRLCMTCGHVGCCDSSVGTHSAKHFDDSGHPVMRSFEPGEAWRWCFVDEVTG